MSSPLLIDAHSHICFNAYKDDAVEVIARAESEGIWQIAVGSQIDTSQRAVAYAERYEHIWAAVGLHPIHLADAHVDLEEVGEEGKEGVAFRTRAEVFDVEAYRELTQHPKVVGIGECGLDFSRIPTTDATPPFAYSHELENSSEQGRAFVRGRQEEMFRQQIALAQEVDLPLIIHVRDGMTNAHDAAIRVLEETYGAWGDRAKPRGLIHCYTGTWDQAQRYLALGFNISFTGIITFTPTKKQLPIAEELWRTVRGVPLDRFHVETDCPYLTPEPHRGKRNEPAYVRHVAEKVAQLRGCSFKEVAGASVANTFRLFRKMTH
ncbi:TatD family hydrolase [Candidatus Uhrbacteria bacterium]|nr:TatD family hydrolase [Candidatus Uhrbacteria bacterium]